MPPFTDNSTIINRCAKYYGSQRAKMIRDM